MEFTIEYEYLILLINCDLLLEGIGLSLHTFIPKFAQDTAGS